LVPIVLQACGMQLGIYYGGDGPRHEEQTHESLKQKNYVYYIFIRACSWIC